MSRLWLAAAFLVAVGVTPTHAAPELISVTLDQAKVAKLPPGASTIILGNPMIADVTLLKDTDAYVITGKGFGQTNLIAIDAQGAVVEERELRVVPARTVVILQNGPSRISYACNPDCMPTVQLGDDTKSFEEAGKQISTRNGFATEAAAASGPTPK